MTTNAQRRRAAKAAVQRTGLPVVVADVEGWERREAKPDEDHRARIEITVAACVETPDHKALGNNVVDVTFVFMAAMPRPPRRLTDAEINRTLMHNIAPVNAAVQSVLTSMGFVFAGTSDRPISANSTWTGDIGQTSTSVTVEMVDVDRTGPVQ